MKNGDLNFKSINEHYDIIKAEYPKLTDYEILSLAIQFQRNEILIEGLQVSQHDGFPSALATIATNSRK